MTHKENKMGTTYASAFTDKSPGRKNREKSGSRQNFNNRSH